MSLSYANVLLKDPARLFELLYSKYGNIDEDVEQLHINQIVYNKKTHYDVLFKEYQYSDIYEEFLRRFYKSQEAFPRIPKLAKYYKNYHLFFCKPVFVEWRINVIMNKYGDTKAEIYYKDNYGTDSKIKNENDQNIESSSSDSSELNTKYKNNANINKTIFDKNIRKFIDNIKSTSSNGNNNPTKQTKQNDSLILNICDDSKLNQTLGLISRRSNNSSFIDLLQTFNIKVTTPTSIRYSNTSSRNYITSNHNSNSNRNSTLITSLPKRNQDATSHSKATNKFLISPKIKMYLNNGKPNSKFSEFNYNNPINLHNITKQTQLIPIINASSNTSNNNNVNTNRIAPSHHKNKSYQQNSIGNNNNSINNSFHNHKSTRLTRNNSKKQNYNLSLKKHSFQSNQISNVNSLNNNYNNNSSNRKTKIKLIKSPPQRSSVNNYLNLVFNLTQHNKKESQHKQNTKTFFVQQSIRSNSYKESNQVFAQRNSRNQNGPRTNTQSVKSLSKTKTIFTRSVDDKEIKRTFVNRGNVIMNSNGNRGGSQVNAMMQILNKQHNVYSGYEEKKNSHQKQFQMFNHKYSQSNKIHEVRGKDNNRNNKGGMLKTLNGFNVGANTKLRIIQNKKHK